MTKLHQNNFAPKDIQDNISTLNRTFIILLKRTPIFFILLHEFQKTFTTFTFVLYQICKLSPSAST